MRRLGSADTASHAAKLARTGVPFYLGHTILRAEGEDHVRKAVIAQVDKTWKPVPGTEKEFDVDTICVAVGLSPMYQLAMTAGCRLSDDPKKGGVHPVVNQFGETSVSGIFAAGDVTGIEEASSAMISGRIAGAAAALRAGYISQEEHDRLYTLYQSSLDQRVRECLQGPIRGTPRSRRLTKGSLCRPACWLRGI